MVRYLSQVILERDGADGAARGRRRRRACARRPPSETRLPSGGGRRRGRRRRDRTGRLRPPRRAALVDRRRGRSSSPSSIALAGSSSGHTTYRASTLISLGTPYTATGGAAITSAFCTSPIAPATLIKQDAIRERGRAGGRPEGRARSRATPRRSPSPAPSRSSTSRPAVNIIVQGPFGGDDDGARRQRPRRAACRRPAASTRSTRLKTTQAPARRASSPSRRRSTSGSPSAQNDARARCRPTRRSRRPSGCSPATIAGEHALERDAAPEPARPVHRRRPVAARADQERRADADHHAGQGLARSPPAARARASASRSCSELLAGIVLALLSYVVVPTRRKET